MMGPLQEQLAAICNEPVLQAATLRLLQERPFASLFPDLGNMSVFNPTGMEHVHNSYYVVFNRRAPHALCSMHPCLRLPVSADPLHACQPHLA